MKTFTKSNCYKRNCVHFMGIKLFGDSNEEESTQHLRPYCFAFPSGIPDKISYGDELHLKPLKNQGNKIVYEKNGDLGMIRELTTKHDKE